MFKTLLSLFSDFVSRFAGYEQRIFRKGNFAIIELSRIKTSVMLKVGIALITVVSLSRVLVNMWLVNA